MKFLNNLNLQKNELQEAVIQHYAGDPSGVLSGNEGQMVYSTTTDALWVNISNGSGTNWSRLATGGNAVTSVIGGDVLTVTNTSATNGAGTIATIDHNEITNADLTASSRTYVDSLTFDDFGHITAYGTSTETVTNTTYGIAVGAAGSNSANIQLNPSSGSTTTVQIAGGTNVTVTENTTTDVITISSTDTNDNDFVDAATWNSATGELTLSVSSQSDVVVDLDGRYLTSFTESDTLDSVTDRGATTSNSITVGGLVVNGDLTVSGAHTVKVAETLQVEDSLFVLNSNEEATPSEDAGFIVERGTSTNQGFIWDESDDTWALIGTAEDGSTAGNVTISNYGDIRVDQLRGNSARLTGVVNANADTDKFVVLDGNGNVLFRTGAEVLDDIGAGAGVMDNFDVSDGTNSTTIGNGDTLTFAAGGDLSVSESSGTVTFSFTESYTSHDNIAAAASVDNSGFTFIQDVTLDSNGHVTGLASATVTAATTAAAGVVELATVIETTTGTDSTRAVTPAGVERFRSDREAVFTIAGDGTTSSFTLTHSFGTRMVMCEIVDYGDGGVGATYETVYADVTRSSDDAVVVEFGTALATTQDYRVMLRVIA